MSGSEKNCKKMRTEGVYFEMQFPPKIRKISLIMREWNVLKQLQIDDQYHIRLDFVQQQYKTLNTFKNNFTSYMIYSICRFGPFGLLTF